MTTTLRPAGRGTDVVVCARGIPDAIPAHDDETGTRMALDNLARLVGAVQHYFSSRDEMILFAMENVAERVTRDCMTAWPSSPIPAPRDRVRGLLRQWLPLDDERTPDARSMFVFMIISSEGPLTDWVRDGVDQLRTGVEQEITAAGHVPNPRLGTTILLAVADGLSAHVLYGQLSRTEAEAALESGSTRHSAPSAAGPDRFCGRGVTAPSGVRAAPGPRRSPVRSRPRATVDPWQDGRERAGPRRGPPPDAARAGRAPVRPGEVRRDAGRVHAAAPRRVVPRPGART